LQNVREELEVVWQGRWLGGTGGNPTRNKKLAGITTFCNSYNVLNDIVAGTDKYERALAYHYYHPPLFFPVSPVLHRYTKDLFPNSRMKFGATKMPTKILR
jgi:hypothetical protein